MSIQEKVILSELLKTKSLIIAFAEVALNEKDYETFLISYEKHLNVCVEQLFSKFPYLADEIDNVL